MNPEQSAELVRLRLEPARSTLNDAIVLAEGGGTPRGKNGVKLHNYYDSKVLPSAPILRAGLLTIPAGCVS